MTNKTKKIIIVSFSILLFSALIFFTVLAPHQFKTSSKKTLELMNNTPFECPKGSSLKVQSWPFGYVRFCEENGKKNGPFEGWEREFKQAAGFMQNDKEIGNWIFWYSNDVKAAEINYIDGVQSGPATIWHNNSNIASKGLMEKDLHHGKWQFWNDKGVLENEIDFIYGVPFEELEQAKKECPSESKLVGPLYYGSQDGIGMAKVICKSKETDYKFSETLWVKKWDIDGKQVQ